MRYGFGIDILGPTIKIGFFEETGKLLEQWTISCPETQDGAQILPTVAEELAQYKACHQLQDDDIIGVGVGIPGPVNSAGVVNKCVNFGWGVFNIDQTLSALTGWKVRSSNIANLAALGECWQGSGTQNMAFMAMNTGLGGAVVCDGNLVYGAHGGSGEIGHMLVNRHEMEPCTCGRCGCVEQYCSPTGIARVARRLLVASSAPSVLRSRRLFNYKTVLEAAASGDELAMEAMNQVFDYAGQVLANICCVTNPDTVVLGGEFCWIGQRAIDGISRYFRKYVFHANENVCFKLAALGEDAGIYGAFKLVLDAFYGQ